MRVLSGMPTKSLAHHLDFKRPNRATFWTVVTIAALLTLVPVCGAAQSDASVEGTLTDQGKPFAKGLVVLQRMKDEHCAKLFSSSHPSAQEVRQLESCARDLPWINTDEKGNYSYRQLAPGWYSIRFLWLLGKLPARETATTCSSVEWAIFFQPGKDTSGKYNAMAQGNPFEIKAGESKQINFEYRDQINGGPNCSGAMAPSAPLVKLENLGNARISVPGVKGVLEINVGATRWETRIRSQKEIYMTAMDRSDQLLISASLQQVPFAASPEKCRGDRWPNQERALRTHNMKPEHLQQTRRGEFALVEFMVPKNQVAELRMKDVHAYWGSGNLCAELHLSKVQFQQEDYSLFEQVLTTTRFLPDEPPAPVLSVDLSVVAYVSQGSKLYLKKNYAEAAAFYQRALDMEKQKRTLNQDMFRVLVDNLGMSYGISGNLPKAKETLEYGITQDATYPLFYYSLACMYGEMDKMEEALGQLRLAYKYRANMIPGEGPVPDPLKDDSFRNFVKNDTFVQAVREMQRQQ